MSHDEMIAVIQAHKDGRFIQVKHVVDGIGDSWNDADSPRWDFKNFDYRIKPEPRSLWRVEHKNGNSAGTFDDEYQAQIYCSSLSDATIHEYKEVLP